MKRLTSLRMVLLVALSIISFGYFTVAAEAFPITYQFTGTEVFGVYNNGVGDITFDDGSFMISFFGDTFNVDTTTDPGIPFNPGLPGTISLSATEIGTVTGSFADLLDVFVIQGDQVVGFGTSTDDLLLVLALGQGLSVYDLTSYFGPITGSLLYASDMTLDVGLLTIEDAATVTFAATAVPEPSTILLIGSGLLGLVGLRRKFRK